MSLKNFRFSARQHICYIARYMLSPVRPSVYPSVTWVSRERWISRHL